MNVGITIICSMLIFGLIVFIHELGHFIAAKLSGIQVDEFSIGMGPTLLKWNRKGTKYSIRLLPIGGYVSMEGEDDPQNDDNKALLEENSTLDNNNSFQSAKLWKRIIVMLAGAFMNLMLGFFVLVYLVNQQDYITSRTVSNFYDNASTQNSGLQVGDEIIAINGRRCFIADDIIYEFARTQNGVAQVTVLRNGNSVNLDIVFEVARMEDGAEHLIIDFTVLPIEKTFLSVLKEGFNWTLSFTRLVFLSFVDIITGHVPINSLSGPIGIVAIIGEASSAGIEPILLILSLISVNLGVFNLLPFPALDGSKIIFLLLEGIRKKPLNPKYEILINTFGFVALMGLMLFVCFNDIMLIFFKR